VKLLPFGLKQTAELAARLERDKTLEAKDVPDMPAFARELWSRANLRNEMAAMRRAEMQDKQRRSAAKRAAQSEDELQGFEAFRLAHPRLSESAARRAYLAADSDGEEWERKTEEEKERLIDALRCRLSRARKKAGR
jgi:hypothetical protein